jgi:carboxypeptidase Q
MARFRFLPRRSASARLPFGLTALALLEILSLSWAQQPATAPAAPTANFEAVALDQKVLAEAKNGSEIMNNLGYLSDIIGPRLTGSAALKRANEWAAEKMRSYGLTDVHLEAYSIPMGWERGTAAARIIEPNNGRSLLVASMGWTPGTKDKVEGDVVVLSARTSKELAAYKGKLKNAIVLQGPPRSINESGFPFGRPRQAPAAGAPAAGNPAPAPGGPARPVAAGETPPFRSQRFDRSFGDMRSFRGELSEFLHTEGAAVVVSDASKPHGLLTTTGSWRSRERAGAAEPLPAVYMAHEHYALLHRLATRPAPARTRVEIEITNKLIPGPIAVYNTVGEIRGREKPDEYVILGAHLDSWDLAQGTTDNGTGTSVVLEAARILAKRGIRPKRTIRFVLFTGEEQGLHGSRAYVQQHKDELPQVSLCLVHDTGTGRVVGLGLQGRAAVKPILEGELAALKEIGFNEINLRGMGGSDHMSFEQAGVPGFAFQQDMSEYRFTHHSQSDTFDKAHEADLIQGAQAMAVIGLRVANLESLLPREKQRPTR